ncbi:hypothetical protein, partial [Mesorhizobium sp. M7A.F.Ca.CA.004.11.2.1]|uniref:hypothetical protein n=1 Tax=Mesorhizobium sp. M7A.F.Ca.CA.004.11.2.1 TaxID=2496699 RepID=UPI0019D259AC
LADRGCSLPFWVFCGGGRSLTTCSVPPPESADEDAVGCSASTELVEDVDVDEVLAQADIASDASKAGTVPA